ncbi:MAG: PQQ-binding-like beta-propeller repeat protein [Myxococcota bacterium]
MSIFDLATGQPRPFVSVPGVLRAACDGTLVFVDGAGRSARGPEPAMLRAVDAHTGTLRWAVELERGSRGFVNCELTPERFAVDGDPFPGDRDTGRLTVFEARTGRVLAELRCRQGCEPVHIVAGGLVVLHDRGEGAIRTGEPAVEARHHLFQARRVVRLPVGHGRLVRVVETESGLVTLVDLPDGLEARALDGRVAWSRRGFFSAVRGATGYSTRGGSLDAVDLATGEVRWSLAVDAALREEPDGGARIRDVGEELVLDVSPGIAALGAMLRVDATSGQIVTMQLAPDGVAEDAVRVGHMLVERRRCGVHTACGREDPGVEGLVSARRLDLETPPLREVQSVEQDVARSLRILLQRGPDASEERHGLHPSTPFDASEWLADLGPLAAPRIRGALEDALSPGSDSPGSKALPDLAEALGVERLGPALARRVSGRVVRELPALRHAVARCPGPPRDCPETGRLRHGVEVLRRLLWRNTTGSAPLRRSEAAARPSPRPCEPAAGDAPRDDLLRYLFATALLGPGSRVHAAGLTCTSFSTPSARLEVSPDPGRRGAAVVVHRDEAADSDWVVTPRGDPAWDRAPRRQVAVDFWRVGRVYLLAEVDGVWRVLATRRTWVA